MDNRFIQGSEEWKEFRHTKITSTNAAVILGISTYETPSKLYRRKLGLEPEQETNYAMSEGSRLEPIALEAFIKEIGIEYSPKVVICPERPWQMTSLDGITKCGLWIVEIKCSEKIYLNALNDVIDPIYIAQCHHHMSVCGLYSCYFFVYWDGKFVLKTILRDDVYMKNLIEKEEEFYGWMQNFQEPPLTAKDYKQIDDHEFEILAQKYLHYKCKEKFYEDEAFQCRLKLLELAENQSCMGRKFKITKYAEKGRINQKELQKDHPEIPFESYRGNPIEKWRVSEI